tara:strand:+ start:623 stop:910 length:288 start_codon:yes stop_codon:yes gene_type:complete
MQNNKNRFSMLSFNSIKHKGKVSRVLTTSTQWQNIITSTRYNLTKVPNGMSGRPDLISQEAYNTPEYWWLVCAINNISDPFEQLIAGKLIKLPVI